MSNESLDKFGEFLMKQFRDRAIEHYDKLAAGEWKAPSVQKLQRELATLTDKQRAIVRRAVINTLDSGVHDFLFAIQENLDFENDISIRVDGVNIAEKSDGLHGELFTEDGWMARFSAYGEPSEED